MKLPAAGPGRTAIVLSVAVMLVAVPSKGADPDARMEDASKHFHHGVELSDDGDWRAALIEFERAYAIAPNFRVLYDIGQCRFQLHDYPGALAALQRYLTEGGDLVPPDRRSAVDTDVQSLKGRVAFLHLVTPQAGAKITVDDAVVGETPLASPLPVSVGRHKVAASKPGFRDVVRYVDVAGEETADVPLDLEVVAPTVTPTPDLAIVDSPARPARSRPIAPAVVAFGVAAVGVGVGTYFGVTALQNKHDLDAACDHGSCPGSSRPLFDDAQRNALWSSVGFGAAIVGAGAGAAYLLFFPRGESSSKPTPSADFRVVVGPGSIGARGAF
ncbi:MAG TPA: PEGA domain-containing protein [Polyangiaceae bacterium]|jgi:hypothetical protein|nr:PEGA domain-containing protein [Polyangiaceae bacterium]